MQPPDRNLVGELADVARRLTHTQVDLLAAALLHGQISSDSGALGLQQVASLSGALSSTLAGILQRWNKAGLTTESLATALLSAQQAATKVLEETPDVQVVWTGPADASTPARSTYSVMVELITSAQQDITILGYSISAGADEIIEKLQEARRRGVRVTIIGNRLDLRLEFLRKRWPSNILPPILYTRPLALDDPQSALHAKVIIVDSHRLLTTSANLTYHGLSGNIEMGVLVKGTVANDIMRLVRALIDLGIVHHLLL